MLTNSLRTAWRSLQRNRTFSLINIFGLALGLSSSLLIMLWIRDEKEMDAFHTNGKYLFQVYERSYYDGKVEGNYYTQGLLAQELKKSFPEIRYATGVDYAAAPGTMSTFELGEKTGKMNGLYVDGDFFRMFSFRVLQGKGENALDAAESLAISRHMADYFFGSPQNAIGKTIRYNNEENLVVSAVFENPGNHSSLQFDFLRSWISFVKQNDWVHNWTNTSPVTIVQLEKTADPARTESKIRDFIHRFTPGSNGFRMELGLQPFPDKYLHSSFRNGRLDGGRIEYVRIFSIVAIFILVIACINFMNLATAQSARRAREVGMRKVIGARRTSLILQFMGEAILLALVSSLVALVTSAMLLPAFNSLTGKEIILPLQSPFFWLAVLAIAFLTGLVAGSYPALFLSSLRPARVFKSQGNQHGEGIFLRKGLVVFQFSISLILITGTLVIYRQMDYVRSKQLGYDRENLLYLPVEGELVKHFDQFRERAQRIPAIADISKMRNSPTVIYHHTGSIGWPGKDPNQVAIFADEVVGYDFVKTMKLTLKEGRDFSREFKTDTAAFLLNETALRKIGWTHAVGKTVNWGSHPCTVIGVVKDFHFNSMHAAIEPLVIRLQEDWPWGTILVRIKPGRTKEALADLEQLTREINPAYPFTWQFSDQEFARLYSADQVVRRLSNFFAGLAIFISSLGLFGLATYTASQRTREIGVRKVLGASVGGIVIMLASQFLRLVLLSLCVAFPLSWFFSSRWLQQFAYRVDLSWWIFAAAGTGTLGIAMITVSYQSIRAARMNPTQSLRTE